MIESGSPPAPGNGANASAPRLAAIDALRGLAMVLMTIDHASSTFNAGRLSRDSAAFVVGTPLPPAQFLTRFVTHVCAPTFLLLAGASVALQLSRRPAREIDRDLALRGMLLIAIEVCWMSWAWSLRLRPLHLDVLYALAIG